MIKTAPCRLHRISSGTFPRHQEWLLYCGILIPICRNSSCLLNQSRVCSEISNKMARKGHYFLRKRELVWDGWIKTSHKISLSSIRYVTSHCCAEELLWPQVLLSSPEQMFLVWKVGPQSRQHCCTGQPGVSETHSSQGNSCAS